MDIRLAFERSKSLGMERQAAYIDALHEEIRRAHLRADLWVFSSREKNYSNNSYRNKNTDNHSKSISNIIDDANSKNYNANFAGRGLGGQDEHGFEESSS